MEWGGGPYSETQKVHMKGQELGSNVSQVDQKTNPIFVYAFVLLAFLYFSMTQKCDAKLNCSLALDFGA